MVGTLTAAASASGSITTFAEAVAAIKAGETYINLHTATGGEIRGQVVAGATPTSWPSTATRKCPP
jgi:hypothetical protein